MIARNKKLKKELAAARKTPKWAKAGQTEEQKKRKKKLGPKRGHQANPRKTPDKIDFEFDLEPNNCPDCDHKLPKPHKWHGHVQIEVPAVLNFYTTRFNTGWSWCKHCKKEVSINDKLSGSKYGPRLHALICYWKFSLGLSLGKIEKFLSTQSQLSLSTGQISEIISRSGREFNDFYDSIGTKLSEQKSLYADESGWRNGGDNWWLWSFSNQNLTYYVLDKTRPVKVVEKTLGESYGGTLITDFYAAYDKIDCAKQKCWTHLLRELRELKVKYPKSKEIKQFSQRLKRLYKRGTALEELFGSGVDITKRLGRLQIDTENGALKKHRHHELKRLAKRLWKYRKELYVFVENAEVDATNNRAEREQRPAVLLRKISYCNRSAQGAKNQAILMSSIRTAEKQGNNFIEMATEHLGSARI